VERGKRGAEDSTFSITGADQKRPKEWQQALCSASFKTSFFQFLSREWNQDNYAMILKGHRVYLAFDKQCILLTEEEGKVKCQQVHALSIQHEEADTRIIFHLAHISRQVSVTPAKNISVRANDTDVFILLLYNKMFICSSSNTLNVWMD